MFNTIKGDSVEKVVKENVSKRSKNDSKRVTSFKYILRNGRMCKKSDAIGVKKFFTDSKNSFMSSKKSKTRLGTRPQSFTKAPLPALDFYNSNKQLFNAFDVDVDKAVVINGCFDTNKNTLQKTATPVVTKESVLNIPKEEDILQLGKAIKATIRKLKIEELEIKRFIDCEICKFHKTTKPGFTAEHIVGHRNKEESCGDSYFAAKEIWDNIEKRVSKVKKRKLSSSDITDTHLKQLLDDFIENPIPGKGFYDIGARNKRDENYIEDDDANSRAVHMPEFHNEIVMSPWIDSITDNIKFKKNGPIYIGNSISDFIRYERDLKKNSSYLEGDWKKFDSTLYLRICICAISILRCFYKLEDLRADAFFMFMIERLCIKDYYLPGGRIVRLLHGLPSGTKSTNLLGSIINLICLNYCISDYNSKNFSFAVGGDDFVIFSKEKIVDEMLITINEKGIELGMEFKFLEEKFLYTKTLGKLPYFYKYSVRDGKPYLKPSDLYWRILCPWNKLYKNSLSYFKFIDEQMPLLGYPNASHLPYYCLYLNMLKRIDANTSMTIGRIYKMHLNSYVKYSDKVYYKSRKDDEECINVLLNNSYHSSRRRNVRILLGMYNNSKATVFAYR